MRQIILNKNTSINFDDRTSLVSVLYMDNVILTMSRLQCSLMTRSELIYKIAELISLKATNKLSNIDKCKFCGFTIKGDRCHNCGAHRDEN